MSNFKTVVGIDVAKDTLAISIYDGKIHQITEFEYTKKSINKELISKFKKEKDSVVFVLESTGVYHTKLAYQLYQNGFSVSVLNPFIIKKYAEMKLMRVKTDSVDSKLIAEYGYEYKDKISFFKPKDDAVLHVDNLIKAIDDLLSQKNTSSNQRHALKRQARHSKEAIKSYDRHIKLINHEIETLETKLKEILKTAFQTEHELLTTIPGVGLKVSSMIIAVFNSFENFDNAKQACSFVGICPSPYESGTSVKGRGSISKRGNTFARKILFMGALSAIQYNPPIRQQYLRLLENGKCKMQALVAALNKLLRQAFGVLKSRTPFKADHLEISKVIG